MKPIVRILLWLWQFPQNLLGLLFCWIYTRQDTIVTSERDIWYYIVPRFRGGISLGETVIIKWRYVENPNAWAHEYGHSRQSLYLGPLYLLAIGLPSLIWAALYRPEKGNYYDFYTERWADRLGGVNRNF